MDGERKIERQLGVGKADVSRLEISHTCIVVRLIHGFGVKLDSASGSCTVSSASVSGSTSGRSGSGK